MATLEETQFVSWFFEKVPKEGIGDSHSGTGARRRRDSEDVTDGLSIGNS